MTLVTNLIWKRSLGSGVVNLIRAMSHQQTCWVESFCSAELAHGPAIDVRGSGSQEELSLPRGMRECVHLRVVALLPHALRVASSP